MYVISAKENWAVKREFVWRQTLKQSIIGRLSDIDEVVLNSWISKMGPAFAQSLKSANRNSTFRILEAKRFDCLSGVLLTVWDQHWELQPDNARVWAAETYRRIQHAVTSDLTLRSRYSRIKFAKRVRTSNSSQKEAQTDFQTGIWEIADSTA